MTPRVRTFGFSAGGRRSSAPLTARAQLIWTIGNACMLAGVIVLLYVGGLYALDEYGRYAARGDSDVPAPAIVDRRAADAPVSSAPSGLPPRQSADAPVSSAPNRLPPQQSAFDIAAGRMSQAAAPFSAPVPTAAPQEGQITSDMPEAPQAEQVSLVSRLILPSIAVDSKVVEVGWDVVEQDGQQVAVWQVAKYAVGQHRGSANPGEGDNIVLAGHVGGYGRVFRDLFYLRAGDPVIVYSGEREYRYVVQERLILDEEGVSPEQRAANARYIEPTGSEMVTMVTCWPASGPNKFTQRVVVRAIPATDPK